MDDLAAEGAAQLLLPEYTVDFSYGGTFTTSRGYDGLSAELTFRRQSTIHLLQTFLPSVLLTLTSVFSVFVPSHLVPGRMGLCVTSFLSMIALFNGSRLVFTLRKMKICIFPKFIFRAKWPTTAYMKAADIWTSGCFCTVFAALAEYCLVLFLVERAQWEKDLERRAKRETGVKPWKKALQVAKIIL